MTKRAQIAEAIFRRIESGALREGDRLPSEEELAANHRVSVGTVQKALASLAHSGLISRQHGRGTFVEGSSLGPSEIRYLRFRDAAGNNLPSHGRVDSVRRVKRKGPWSEFLGGDSFIRIDRSINVGGRLELHSEFMLRGDDFSRLGGNKQSILGGNVRQLLAERLALPTLHVDQWIRFEPLPRSAARGLGLEAGQSGFVMELRAYTLRDRPLFYQCVYSGPFSDSLVIVR